MNPTTMTTLPCLSLLLAALLAQGSCLICETCTGSGEDCTGLKQTCGTGEDTCLTSVGRSSLGDDKIIETVKMCIAASNCQPGSSSVTVNAGIHFSSTVSCCRNNLCNHVKLNVPPANTTPNRLSCPACFNLGSDQCDVTESLSCTGEENHCITVSGTLTVGGLPSTFVARGCSSASSCSLPLETSIYSAGLTFHLNKVGCSPALKAGNS